MAYEFLGRLPYPEIAEPVWDPREYEIHDSCNRIGAISLGMVDLVERIMLVPLSREGRGIARHELAHVRWSPKQMPETACDKLIVMCVEDARINLALEHKGLACALSGEFGVYARRLAHADLQQGARAVLLLRCIASLGGDLTPQLMAIAAADPQLQPLAAWLVPEVAKRLEASRLRTPEREIAPLHAALRIAAFVAKQLERHGLALDEQSRRRLIAGGGFCGSRFHESEDEPRLYLPARGSGGPEDSEAAEMFVREPELPIALAPRRRAPGHRRALKEGAVVRYIDRWVSDRAIFRGRARGQGGSVLVDTSHSMRLTADDVDRIVRAAPMATLIAIYSGDRGRGELRIVARDGRRAAAEGLAPYGPGNLIDLPALEWLSRQPSPRVWLSDGLVTGVNDWASRSIARRCRVVCLRHGIRRADDAEHAAAILEGRALRVLPVLP